MTMDEAAVERVLREVAEHAAGAAPAASSAPVLDHIVKLVSPLLAAANFEEDVWDQVCSRCPPPVPPWHRGRQIFHSGVGMLCGVL